LDAVKRLEGIVTRTPVLSSSFFNDLVGCKVYFKCENLQKTGVFKIRGAYNAISQLNENIDTIVTHSSGNHAAAVALASKLTNRKSKIIMPSNSPEIKKLAVKGYGGEIIICEPTLKSREETAEKISEEYNNAPIIHPYNDLNVIYGQSTIGIELIEDCNYNLDCILVPIGGGGMISGITLAVNAIHTINNKFKKPFIIGIEPEGANDAY